MIVISGALVLVALVLLIIGVVGPDLTFVYASIAVSLVSLVFLVVGILQRRGETAPAQAAGAPVPPQPADAASVTAVIPSQEARESMRKAAQDAPAADAEAAATGTVLVVAGRPRYHVAGCRYLSGKSAEPVDVTKAREDGFSACGVCKPDDAVAAAAQAAPIEEQAAAEPVVEEDVPGVEVPAARGTQKAPVRKKAAPGKAAPAKAPAVKAVKAVKAPAAKAAAARPPAKATGGSVVVIPDRGRFHKPECRFVRDADGAESMSRAAASRSGYTACGVCKP